MTPFVYTIDIIVIVVACFCVILILGFVVWLGIQVFKPTPTELKRLKTKLRQERTLNEEL